MRGLGGLDSRRFRGRGRRRRKRKGGWRRRGRGLRTGALVIVMVIVSRMKAVVMARLVVWDCSLGCEDQ